MRRKVTELLLVAGLMPPLLVAHEGHKVMGTVTAVDENRVEVKGRDGKTVSIALTPATKYLRSGANTTTKPAASLADVKVGQRVVIAVAEEGGKMTGREIMFAAEKAHPHSDQRQH